MELEKSVIGELKATGEMDAIGSTDVIDATEATDAKKILEVKNLTKSFKEISGDDKITVLKDFNLSLKQSEIIAITGESGCGKSTLLQIMGLLDEATSGEIIINGQNIAGLSEAKLTKLRKNYLGFVYQYHYLLSDFTAVENVMMPSLILGKNKKQALENARHILAEFNLENRLNHLPAKLSGGQQQRVAIARAIAHSPKIILADEPTGNLDPETASKIFAILVKIIKEKQLSMIFVTHNKDIAQNADRQIEL